MLGKLLVLFKIPELRNKILLTLGLLAIYRMGFWIALPFVNQAQLAETLKDLQTQSGGLGQFMQVISLFLLLILARARSLAWALCLISQHPLSSS